jgi:hypothetical protein
MRTMIQQAALAAPLIGREGDHVQAWADAPWTLGLSFNR